MPISLRLPAEVESQIAGYSARLGVSKSALIVRSIQEFLLRHTQPSSLQIYEAAMRAADKRSLQGRGSTAESGAFQDAAREAVEQRPHKIAVREALRRKHAERSARASQALSKTKSKLRKPA